MGNQVVVVVPFSQFNAIRKIDAVSEMQRDINNPDFNFVKNIRIGSYPQRLFGSSEFSGHMLCSQYHHASDNASLYLDSDNMTYFPNHKQSVHDAEDKVDALLKNYRFDLKHLSVTQSKRSIQPLPDLKEKYLVFGFLTDNMSYLNNMQLAVLLDYAESLETLEDNESVVVCYKHSKYGHYNTGKFIPIAILNHSQFAIVSLDRNTFKLTAMKQYQKFKPEMLEIKNFDNSSFSKEKGAVAQSFQRHIVESLGFNVKPK